MIFLTAEGHELAEFRVFVDIKEIVKPWEGALCRRIDGRERGRGKGSTVKYYCDASMVGRYVTVFLPTGHLSVCELEVLGVPLKGKIFRKSSLSG